MSDTIWPGMVQFGNDVPSWKCSNCNFVFRGENPPKKCPLCHADADFDLVREERDFSEIGND